MLYPPTRLLLLVLVTIVVIAPGAIYAQTGEDGIMVPADEQLLTVDSESTKESPVRSVKLHESLTTPGSRTTDLSTLRTPEAVEDFTLEIPLIGRVVFRGAVDLTTDPAIDVLKQLEKYLVIRPLEIEINVAVTDAFKVPMELFLYRVPFVWDPDITHDGVDISRDKVSRYTRTTIDGIDTISFIVTEPGLYRLRPRLDIFLDAESSTRRSPLTVNGRVADPKAVVRATVNTTDLPADSISIDQRTGQFSLNIPLDPGSNILIVRALSDYGDAATVTRLIYFEQLGVAVPRPQQEASPMVFLALALGVVTVGLVVAIRLSQR